MPVARYSQTVVMNGKIYVIGEQREDGNLKILGEYDPVTGEWKDMAELPGPRFKPLPIVKTKICHF